MIQIMQKSNQPDNGSFSTDADGNIKVTMAEYPVAYVEQLKFNIQQDRNKYEWLEEKLESLREVGWCVITSIQDPDDRKYLKDELNIDKDEEQ